MEKIFYLGMMIAAGLLFGLQSPINAQLSRSVGVLEGSFLSFLGGTLVLGIAVLLFGKGHVGGVFGVPAWQLVGGLLGATVVFNTILCVPHIGVLPTLMAMILGNLIMGCIIDHFGWFGIPVNLFTCGVFWVSCWSCLAFSSRSDANIPFSYRSFSFFPQFSFHFPKEKAARTASSGLFSFVIST